MIYYARLAAEFIATAASFLAFVLFAVSLAATLKG
jgi:hypothetical protein